MPNLTVVAALLASLIGAPPAADPPPPQNPGRVTVELVADFGSGCAPGTAFVSISPNNSDIHVDYGQYLAWIGPGASPIDFRKYCQANLVVHMPAGWSYAVTGHTHIALVNLAAGASATLRANSVFLGRPTASIPHLHTFTGPLNDELAVDDTIGAESWEYSRCDVPETLQIATDLRILRGTSDPKLVDSFVALEETHNIHLAYRPCTPA